MLPQLQAEESLREVTRLAMGGGHLAEEEQQRIRTTWQRVAAGLSAEDDPKPVKATPEDLKRLGIAFRKVKRKPKETNG